MHVWSEFFSLADIALMDVEDNEPTEHEEKIDSAVAEEKACRECVRMSMNEAGGMKGNNEQRSDTTPGFYSG